jgi:DNA (cytosine-5)-methyltransferase 1
MDLLQTENPIMAMAKLSAVQKAHPHRAFANDLFCALGPSEDIFSSFCDEMDVKSSPGWPDHFGKALFQWSRAKRNFRSIRTLSLFSGAGGLDIGFHDAGFQIVEAIEIDQKFALTLSANAVEDGYLQGTKVNCIDIREYVPKRHEKYDFIIGGPPCQTFSAAGRRAAGVKGTQDERGVLFKEYVRLLRQLNPAGFLFENVYGITGAEGGRAWKEICAAFAEVGYKIFHRILDAADYGVPQHRERIFIVGIKEGEYRFPAPTHGPDSPARRSLYAAGEAIESVDNRNQTLKATLNGRYGHLLKDIPPGLNYSFFTEKMGHPEPIFAWRSKFSDFLYKADPNTPIRTLKAQGGQYTGPFHWESRAFSVSELKRLQTIPDNYEISGSKQTAIHQIGNSVPPQLARILAISVLEQIFDVSFPVSLPTLNERDQLGFRKRKRVLTNIYRNKAVDALSTNKATLRKSSNSPGRTYHADLANGFELTPTRESNGAFEVQCKFQSALWSIRIKADKKSSNKTNAFEIKLLGHTSESWALKSKTVSLSGDCLDEKIFTSAWKAFERELINQNIKADLVQLCEYYQYKPRFRAKMITKGQPDNNWKVLKQVVEGVGTREILTESQMAQLWGVSEKRVLHYALWLRSLGYEVRNHSTNPQIPMGSYLIPYFFPTLTVMSVQLRKKLVKSDDK